MYDVYIRFIDGATLRFRAREFNINVVGRLPPEQKPKRFGFLRSRSPSASPTRTPTASRRPSTLGSTRLPRSW